ncbi:unnamed protein product, partial [Thelazia callipaeda]|uniref:VWFA domain-containing protein n=1 Tax=Thelazia callipaeda TaxID=103827 RepID=A0A0N5CVE2_THECL
KLDTSELPAALLTTDEIGHVIYPVFSPDGQLLSTDETGRHVDHEGKPISINEAGLPLDEHGKLIPTDDEGQFLRPLFGLDGKPIATDMYKRPIYPVVDAKGRALPTDESGFTLDHYGKPIPTDESGVPLNARGQPLAKDEYGRYKLDTSEIPAALLTTDGSSSIICIHIDVMLFGECFVDFRVSPSHCKVSSNADLIIVLDASSNVRILDYRIMKEVVEDFLVNHFDLQYNHIRVGVVKFGDKVEVPVSLGDYEGQNQLFSKISETRRMRGKAHLGAALRDVAGELLISGSRDVPRVVIIFSSGRSRDELAENARLLRDDMKALIYLVDVGNQGDNEQNAAVVGPSFPHRIATSDDWSQVDSRTLGPFADELCQLLPQIATDEEWPIEPTTVLFTNSSRLCKRIDFQADIIFALDSSESITSQEYNNLKQSMNALIDKSFDLSPDIVRIGFIEYSDKASVPVPLGHYDDKVELLTLISNSKKLGGTAIILKGLHAASEQFKQHSRDNVPKILIMITPGIHRGNGAFAAEDLRRKLDVNIFVLAVSTSHKARMSLNRLVGSEYAQQRIITISGANKLHESALVEITHSVCSSVDLTSSTRSPLLETPHRTTKREVVFSEPKHKLSEISTFPLRRLKTIATGFTSTPLCNDGLLRPYQLSIIVDSTARSPEQDFRLVLSEVTTFLKSRFASQSHLMQLNLVGVDSDGIYLKIAKFGVDMLDQNFAKIAQKRQVSTIIIREDEVSPKLGEGIEEAISLANNHIIKGVIQIILIISSDGTSSDDAKLSAEYARIHGYGIVAVSIRAPTDVLLKELALGSPTKFVLFRKYHIYRVIHFSNWSVNNELFHNWMAHAFCSYVATPMARRVTTRMTRPPVHKTSKLSVTEPTNVKVTPLSPHSFSVSWTCCTNNKANYTILYSPDSSLMKEYWQRVNANCRDSFGRKIDELPTDTTYTICVETSSQTTNNSVPLNLNECDVVELNHEITASQDLEAPERQLIEPCQCICADSGEAVIKPTCSPHMDPFRPVATLPPALNGECPCSMSSKSGRCPAGYFFNRGICYDVNECLQQNGGCSHGCVNTPGDYYCACPHGMMRDPMNPKVCINAASSFDRIAALLGQYLHANRFNASGTLVDGNNGQIDDKIVKYKATVKSEDDKTISFEWSLVPAVVRRTFQWLF